MIDTSWADVVTLGETMALIQSRSPGPLQHAHGLNLAMGGSESNFAIALRRLGTPVTWVGRVGADSLGDYIRRELAAEHIDAEVVADPGAPTGLMIKERRTAMTQKVWYYRTSSAGSRLCPDDLPVEKIRNARLLHITGITPALSGSAAEAIDRAIEIAKDADTIVSFDVNYRSALWAPEVAAQVFRTMAGAADVVFAGDDEAALFVGPADDPLELAGRIEALGPAQVIIKLGERGCVAIIDGTAHRTDAFGVDAFDTVGAGDGFVAGYVSELLAGVPPDGRLDTAVRVGAFACLVPGDWEGMPRRDELKMLDSREPVTR
jgi:2-dehydro-3-deoxygluconokinase